MRFPLVFTVWADVLTGYFLACHAAQKPAESLDVAVMLGVAAGVYWGGMMLNDCFDVESAREHGRHKALPASIVSVSSAYATALLLIIAAVTGAVIFSRAAGIAGGAVALLLVVYAAITKDVPYLGAANMAVCRGCNLLLGFAFAHVHGPLIQQTILLGPILAVSGYVFLVTQISSEEERPRAEVLVGFTAALVVLLLLLTGVHYYSSLSHAEWYLIATVTVFVLGVVFRLLQVARRTVHDLTPGSVEKLVMAGLVGTIVLDANFTAFAGQSGPTFGVLFLLVPTFLMLRFFRALYPGTNTAID
jgi:4-hydroxybenzoate polyprenyltransferase